MNRLLVGKISALVLFFATGTILITYFSTRSTGTKEAETKDIYIFGISSKVNDKNLPDEISNTNYVCKFNEKIYDNCHISLIKDFDATTKKINIEGLQEENTTTEIKRAATRKEGNIFKIKIDKSIGDWSSGNKKIEVVNKTENEKKYASLKAIFALNEDYSINQYTKTKFFVLETPDQQYSNDQFSPIYNCANNGKETSENCNIVFFNTNGSNDKTLNELVFSKPTSWTTNSAMGKNQHYLVKLNQETLATLKSIKLEQNTLTALGGSQYNPTNYINSKKITPAIYISEKPDNIFILE